MRDWNLQLGDPIALTLSADFRLGETDYANDQTWEFDFGNGDPAALALRTTYGLRARAMRMFPRFIDNGKIYADPKDFHSPIRIRRFYPNFAIITFEPIEGIEVTAEYWVPSSQVITGRLTIANISNTPHAPQLEWIGQLVPLDGQSLAPFQIQNAVVLAGRTGGLAPVVFITGGPQAGPGPYPSLNLGLNLPSGATRQITWVHAALATTDESFNLARRTASRTWDQERGRIEMVNESQTIEIETADKDWDAVLALSQKNAFRLFLNNTKHLPAPSFVTVRQADHGYSPRADGSAYNHLWNGQTALDSYYISGLIPGATQHAKGLLKNFLSTQNAEGGIDFKPGLAGQRGRFTAAPLLASLALNLFRAESESAFLAEIFPSLLKFFNSWFSPANDRDNNGVPEWAHVLQSGFEENPLFSPWHDGQGAAVNSAQSPTLAAMLYREAHSLMKIAELINSDADIMALKIHAGVLRAAVEACWHSDRAFYRYSDRDTHQSWRGKVIATFTSTPQVILKKRFKHAVRFLIRVKANEGAVARPEIKTHGYMQGKPQTETLTRDDFQWIGDTAIATTQKVYSSISRLEINGLVESDEVILSTVDFSTEDHSLFLPLWAHLPDDRHAQTLIQRTLLDAERFYRPFGIPASPASADPETDPALASIHLIWNQLIIEGLLSYGKRTEAATLLAHLMTAIIQNLKRNRSFYKLYHAESGAGTGERNALAGLAPVGLFLQVLGVQIFSANEAHLQGENPFAWTVTVKYKGLRVTRSFGETEIVFPNGKTTKLKDSPNLNVIVTSVA